MAPVVSGTPPSQQLEDSCDTFSEVVEEYQALPPTDSLFDAYEYTGEKGEFLIYFFDQVANATVPNSKSISLIVPEKDNFHGFVTFYDQEGCSLGHIPFPPAMLKDIVKAMEGKQV